MDVTYDGSPVPSSPFQVPVTEGCDPSRVRVHGPGIQSGTTNKPNKFTVETRWARAPQAGAAVGIRSHGITSCLFGLGELAQGAWAWLLRAPLRPRCPAWTTRMAAARLSMSPTRPAPTALTSLTAATKCQVRNQVSWGLAGATCLPSSLSQKCHLSAPTGSPFKVPVHDVTDASKVKCSGPGLSPGMVRANLPQSFQVDTSKAGMAPLQVKVQGPKGECVWGVGVRSGGPGPLREGVSHTLGWDAGGQAVDGGAAGDTRASDLVKGTKRT